MATSLSEPGAAVLERSIDALEEGVQVLAPDWTYLYVNAAAARQGRKPASELVGRKMTDCYPGIEATRMFAVLERCLAEGRSETLENEFAYEDGSRAWFELRVRPVPDGVVVLSVDTTGRKRAESQLAEAYRQALRDLVTPVLRLHHGVLLVPLVGALEHERAERITEAVLERAAAEGAKVVIVDIAGVPELDTEAADHLVRATAMLRMLGASTVLTGMAPAVATAIVRLGVDLSAMRTTAQLSEGIDLALAMVGVKRVTR